MEPSESPRPAVEWRRNHLLGLEDLTSEEILFILDTAEGFREVSTRSVKKVPALRGKVIVNLFFEASTRTRISFELAGARLSADVVNFSGSSSSTVKGESLIDTARNIEAMSPDCVVIRHAASGAAHLLARALRCSVVNAGDGMHEHPTQALLDLLTIREKRGEAVPAALEAVIAQAMAKHPADRYRDATALIKALDDLPEVPVWAPSDATAWWAAARLMPITVRRAATSSKVATVTARTPDPREVERTVRSPSAQVVAPDVSSIEEREEG